MLSWNVYHGNFNTKQIETHNVFDHPGFAEDYRKAARKYKDDKEKFLEAIKTSLMYYYWGKCEWEILLARWPYYDGDTMKKIDVYSQIALNWERFSEYVWENRKEMLKK